MKKLIYILSVFLMLFVTACSNGSSDSSDQVYNFDFASKFMYDGLKKCHPKMKEIWPGDVVLKEENFNMILVDAKANPNNTHICLITPAGITPITEKTQEITNALESIQGANFYKITYDGKNAMMIDMTFTDQEIAMRKQVGMPTSPEALCCDRLDLFYHESFHEYVQEIANPKWGNPDSKDREQEWPIEFKPRTYRVLCNLALLEAWDNKAKKDEFYSRAKYWLERYESECGTEATAIKVTDISEGTANYFGKNVVQAVFPDFEQFERPSGLQLASKVDGESYSLGSLSICLLKRDGKLNDAIAKFKEDYSTPVKLLLEGVTAPQGYNGDKEEETTIKNIKDAQDQVYKPEGDRAERIAAIIKDYKEGGKTYLVADSETATSDSYSLRDLSGFNCYLNLSLSTPYVDVNDITALQTNFVITDVSTNPYQYFILPVESVTFADEAAYSNPITINGNAGSEKTTGKITAITKLSKVDVTIKDNVKTKTCYKVSYTPDGASSANVFYIIPAEKQSLSNQ